MKVLIVVTHLLGTGHLARAAVLGAAFAKTGHQVTLVSGGMPVPHLDISMMHLLQLAPLRSDGVNFRRLLDQDGAPATEHLMALRRKMLISGVRDMHPDVVITELYPFGRRVLAGEFQQLLEVARALSPRPLIAASIRDILAPPSKPEKAQITAEVLASFYDAVLVHSDPALVPLHQSWPMTSDIAAMLRYTGFVAPRPAGPHPGRLGEDEILVTAGGGDVGQRLYQTALLAARETPGQRWRLLVGGGQAAALIERLRAQATENCAITPPTPDFRRMLYHARACVSFCGYNTALDILQAGTPAVFVPFDEGGETEQSLRAQALSNLSGIEVLKSRDLGEASLLGALERVRQAGKRVSGKFKADGARRTVELVTKLHSKARA